WNNIVPVENGGGKVGFLWSNLLISKLFGLGAFVIPFFFGAVAIFSLRIKRVRLLRLFFLSAFGAIIISVFFSYIFGFTRFVDWFGNGAGGSYGYYVNEWLISMIGATGAGLLISTILVLWLFLCSYRFVSWFNMGIAAIFHRKPKEKPLEADAVAGEDPEDPFELIIDGDGGVAGDEAAERSEAAGPGAAEAAAGSAAGAAATGEIPLEIPLETPIDIFNEDISGEETTQEDEDTEDTDDSSQDFLKDIPPGSLDTLFDPRLDLSSYKSPGIELLDDYRDKRFEVSREELEMNKRRIVKTLGDYKIGIDRITARTGPTVTMYEITPSAGVRISQIKRLEDDIAMSLAARGVRIIAPIPGTNSVGIEVANSKPSVVPLKTMLMEDKFRNSGYELPIVLGRTISNEPLTFDLAKMPHLLVAGATGQGKSVGLNAIITSLLYTKHPSEMKFVLVDPKKVELSLYSKIEHHFLAKLP
ncbi:MAG: DNA translocase FtsK 4TM domain-containing protein, partial [Bacteroidales bacterium]